MPSTGLTNGVIRPLWEVTLFPLDQGLAVPRFDGVLRSGMLAPSSEGPCVTVIRGRRNVF